MPSFDFTDPSGKVHTVTGPDGATQEQAFAILQQQLKGATPPAAAPQDDGSVIGPGLKALGLDKYAHEGGFNDYMRDVVTNHNKAQTAMLGLAGSSIANIPGAAINGAADIYRRLTGGDTSKPGPFPMVGPGQAAREELQDTARAAAPAVQAAGSALQGVEAAREKLPGAGAAPATFNDTPLGDVARNVPQVAGDVGSIVAPFSIVKSLYGNARNAMAEALRSTSARSEASYQAAKGTMGWGTDASAAAGGDPTAGMTSGSPGIRSLEAQSFNARLQERYQQIADYFKGRFQSVFGIPDGAAPPAMDAAFSRARDGAEQTVNGMRRAASDAYSKGMAKAQALSDQVAYGPNPETGPVTINQGGVPATAEAPYQTVPQVGARVRADNFAQQYAATVAEDQGRFGGNVLPSDFVRDARQALAAGNGQLSVKDTAGLLRRLTSMSQDDNPQLRALANRLRDSFDTDLDLVAQDSSGAHPAVQQVLGTRAAYRAAQAEIDTFRQTAALKFLGVSEGERAVDPASLVQRFSGFTPEKQASIATYLRSNSPELLSQMRSSVLRSALEEGTRGMGPAALSSADPDKIMGAIFGSSDRVQTSGLWSPAELRQMQGFREGVRVINNMAQKVTGGVGTIVQPAEIAQNAASRNLTFVTRLLTRALTAGQGDKLFSDPAVYRRVTAIRDTTGSTQAAAVASLASYLQNEQGPAPR